MRGLQHVSVCTLEYSIDYPPESPPNHKLTSQMQCKSRENGSSSYERRVGGEEVGWRDGKAGEEVGWRDGKAIAHA